MSNPLDAALSHLDANADATRDQLIEWLRIPSVSAQPAHAPDCVRAAEWMRAQLAAIGFEASVRPTGGHPAVVAHHPGTRPGAPHVLIYGHYDVQPAEPFELWTSPPFEPAIVDGPHGQRVVARGAVDDKGQCVTWLAALGAWHAVAGGPPCRVTVLVEGEEEISSSNLDRFLAANRDELAADFALISDTGAWDIDTPAITTRLRGTIGASVTLRAASRDLHSGVYGGSALNALHAMARLIASLHDDDGRVAVAGFYDGVEELDGAQRAEWDALGFSEAEFLGGIGLATPAGERGRGALERLWARPTCEVNGMWGGYQGPGGKTVIAAEAHAKITCRLVGRQDPKAIGAALKRHLETHAHPDARVTVAVGDGSPGVVVPTDGRFVAAARAALADEYGRPPISMGCGGSIPVVGSLQRILGLDTVLMGFGLEDDQVHSPNEKFELVCLQRGARGHARLLARLGG